jgi:hypothetical protein
MCPVLVLEQLEFSSLLGCAHSWWQTPSWLRFALIVLIVSAVPLKPDTKALMADLQKETPELINN